MTKKSLTTKNNFAPVSWGSLPKNKNGTVQKRALAEMIISLLDKYSASLCIAKPVAKVVAKVVAKKTKKKSSKPKAQPDNYQPV